MKEYVAINWTPGNIPMFPGMYLVTTKNGDVSTAGYAGKGIWNHVSAEEIVAYAPNISGYKPQAFADSPGTVVKNLFPDVFACKIWSKEDLLHTVESMWEEEWRLDFSRENFDEIAEEAMNFTSDDLLEECTDEEWNSLYNAVSKAIQFMKTEGRL